MLDINVCVLVVDVIHPLKKYLPRLTFLTTKKLWRNLLFGCIYLTLCQGRSSLSR